jgi:hypothetical protein
VVMNRLRLWSLPDVRSVILGPDRRAWDDNRAFEPFSCWNDDYRIKAQARLTAAGEQQAESAWRGAAAAYWSLLADPTRGAAFYLREDVTLRIRGGTFPSWAADPRDPARVDESKVTARIGHHTFITG